VIGSGEIVTGPGEIVTGSIKSWDRFGSGLSRVPVTNTRVCSLSEGPGIYQGKHPRGLVAYRGSGVFGLQFGLQFELQSWGGNQIKEITSYRKP
jgi:predicted porin